MKTNPRSSLYKLVKIFFFIGLLCSGNTVNLYSQMVKVPLEQLAISSPTIIRGNVSRKWSEYETDGKNIVTFITFRVSETIKGELKDTVTVVIPGGVVGTVGMGVSHTPKFRIGEEVIIFISDDYKGRPTVTEWVQGKLQIINNRVFYESNEISAGDFILGLKNFLQKGEKGKIEINYNNNTPNSPLSGPSVSSISPNNGPALRPYAINPNDPFNPGERGTVVDIYGSNFGSVRGISKVTFNSVDAEEYPLWTDTQIQCKVPGGQWNGDDFPNASSGVVYVVTSGGTSNGVQFNISFSTPNKRYSNSSMIFYVNQNGTADADGEFTALQSALQTWTGISNSNHSFVYGGTTTRTPGIFNGYNDIGWIESSWNYSASAIAVNTWWFDASVNSDLIYESDISINGVNFSWTTTNQSGRMDVQNILTHELGHALNLLDLYGTNDGEKTMYGYSIANETKQRTLEPEDILGVVYLYPYPFSLTLKNSFEFDGDNYGQLTVKNLTQSTNTVAYNSPLNKTVYWGTDFEALANDQYTINGRGYYYAGWSDDISIQNPRTITTTDNQTYSAFYKYPRHSNQTNAYSNSSQRKFVETYDPDINLKTLHIVYESMGHIWYETSTNNGSSWNLMNEGKPLDNGGGKSPSIDFHYTSSSPNRSNVIVIVWQENIGGSAGLRMAVFYHDGSTGSTSFYKSYDDYILVPEELDYTKPYSENYNPVVGWNNPNAEGQVLILWQGRYQGLFGITDGLVYKLGSLGTSGISWDISTPTQIVAQNFSTDINSVNPSIVSYKESPYGYGWNIAWEQIINPTTSQIKYSRLDWNILNQNLEIGYIDEVSYNSGYSKNYQPSILLRKVGDYYLPYITWLGYRSTPSASTNVIMRYKQYGSWSSSSVYGNNSVQSFSVNNAGYIYGQYVLGLGWSESVSQGVPVYVNKAIKIGSSGTINSLSTTGKDLQINNSSSYSSMFVNSFQSKTLPYSFSLSQSFASLSKENSLAMLNAREGVVGKNGAQFFFALGDISVNSQNVDFIPIPDSVDINNIESANNYLVSEPFTVNESSNLVYGVQYGITDSVLCSSALANNVEINFRVELIDTQTDEVLGVFDEVTYSGQNVYQYNNLGYQVNLSGIGNRTIKFRLVVSTNADFGYSLSNRLADQSLLAKNNYQTVSFRGSLAVTDYALEQNYPNPFNPSTTIKFQLPKDGFVTLKVYDILGNEIATLLNEEKTQGRYEVNFNASNLASGVYIYKIQSGEYFNSKKMLLLK